MVSDRLLKFYAEAKRRRLFGVLVLYVVGAWVTLQVAATLFPGWQIPNEAIRFVWLGAVALLPAVLIFGWLFDVTTTGIRRTPAANANIESVPLAGRDYAVLSLLVVAVAGISFAVIDETLGLRDHSPDLSGALDVPPNSVAVLPFVNMSGNQADEYFSDGITEQLLNELARIPGLHVAARTSSFFFKGKNEMMQVMGRELGVRTLLEGSVRRSGDTVRITAQLINASDGFHIWSDTFDRNLDDVFYVQDEIANAIVSMLRIELLGRDSERLGRVMTDSIEAFDLYLKAMETRRQVSPESLDESNDMYRTVIVLDPEFAEAYDALAYGFLLKSYNGTMSTDDATTEAAGLLNTALDIQPDLEQAHATLGLLKTRLGEYEEANAHYETALDLNANYFGGQLNYGFNLVLQSKLKAGSAAYLKAQSLDPLNSSLNFNLGALMMLMGEVDSGLNFMQRALEIDPDLSLVKGAMTHWLAEYGRLAEAVQYGRSVLVSDPDHVWNIRALARAYGDLGMPDAASDLLTAADEKFPGNEVVREAAVTLMLASGDIDAYIGMAEKEFREVDANMGDVLSRSESGRVFRYAMAALIGGENERAAEHFYWAAGGESGLSSKSYDEMRVLKLLALAYRRLDRFEESDNLLQRCLELAREAEDNGWNTPSLDVRVAEIYAIAGDVENAARHLEAAFEKGWRGLSDIEFGVAWRDLQDTPEISDVMLKIFDDIEMQRKRLEEPATASVRIVQPYLDSSNT